MNATDKLDATATDTLIRFLAKHFGVKRPRLRITNRHANHGTYFPNRIRLSRGAELWVVLHEFAHHLDRIINGTAHREHLYLHGFSNFRRPHTRAISHGEGFYNGLRNVVDAAGCTDYPWTREYKQIARWAKRDGLTIEAAEHAARSFRP